MFEALKSVWEERSDNFYDNYMKIKLFLFMVQYLRATGDLETWESMYGMKSSV